MKIALASDHGGFDLKEIIKEYLIQKGYQVVDLGTDNNTDSVDYPKYGKLCATNVVEGNAERGIVFCGTGIGISIAANKVKGSRCALCTSVFMAQMAKCHNDANLLALGGRTTEPELAKEIVDTWLTGEFEGGRHQRRVDLLDGMEY